MKHTPKSSKPDLAATASERRFSHKAGRFLLQAPQRAIKRVLNAIGGLPDQNDTTRDRPFWSYSLYSHFWRGGVYA